jgi:hypothetical protein
LDTEPQSAHVWTNDEALALMVAAVVLVFLVAIMTVTLMR